LPATFQPGFSIGPFGRNRNAGHFQLLKKPDHTAGASRLEKEICTNIRTEFSYFQFLVCGAEALNFHLLPLWNEQNRPSSSGLKEIRRLTSICPWKWIVIPEIQVNERRSPISRGVAAQLELLRWIGT